MAADAAAFHTYSEEDNEWTEASSSASGPSRKRRRGGFKGGQTKKFRRSRSGAR